MIFANWKLNPQTKEEAVKMACFSDYENVVICPPFVYIEAVRDIIKRAKLGAQNCYHQKSGAYTGEVSAEMLKGLGCEYVILGHSERREYFSESSSFVNSKIKIVLEKELTPVVCVGEKQKENAIGQIEEQVKETLQSVPLEKVIIAYEPVFAIGTGDFCPMDLAGERRELIEGILKESCNGSPLKIIYGGSVNSSNASLYIKEAGFGGVLVGGASLIEDEFTKLVKSII